MNEQERKNKQMSKWANIAALFWFPQLITLFVTYQFVSLWFETNKDTFIFMLLGGMLGVFLQVIFAHITRDIKITGGEVNVDKDN